MSFVALALFISYVKKLNVFMFLHLENPQNIKICFSAGLLPLKVVGCFTLW
jgi:hypothetical protein